MAIASDTTAPKQRVIGRPFEPGVSGNPKGRPRGSRHAISEAFLRDAYAVWEEHGIEALKMCAVADPSKFCSIIAGLLPKDISLSADITVQTAMTAVQAFRTLQALPAAELRALKDQAADE
jgi:hypothetical protein